MNKLFKGMGIALLINLLFGSFADLALAQKAKQKALRQGFPGRRIGAGTRDDKALDTKPLTALIPDSHFGQTVNPYPSLQLYVPPTVAPKLVEVVVRDDQDNQVYKSIFLMQPQTSLISLKLFAETGALPLEVNRDYHWYFSIIQNPERRSQDIVVEGWIRRVAASAELQAKLANATPLEQVALYQAADLWHDAVSVLAELYQANPADQAVTTKWQELMQSVGLDHIREAGETVQAVR